MSQKTKHRHRHFKMGTLKDSKGKDVVIYETKDGYYMTTTPSSWAKIEKEDQRLFDVRSRGMKVQYSLTYYDDSYMKTKHDIYVTRVTSDTIFVEGERAQGRRGTIDQYDRKTGILRVEDGFHSRIGTPRIRQESLKKIDELAKTAKEVVFC